MSLWFQDKASPLFIAAQNGHEEVCRALVRAGAAVDGARADRATALWIAAQCGHQHVARLLLAAGASVDQVRQVILISITYYPTQLKQAYPSRYLHPITDVCATTRHSAML